MVGWFVSDLRELSQGLGSEGFFFFGLSFSQVGGGFVSDAAEILLFVVMPR